MKSRMEQFSDYAAKKGFPDSPIIFSFWNSLQNELAKHEIQPPKTAPKDRRIIVYDDCDIAYCAEFVGHENGNWKISHGFWLWNISGWKEIP